MQRLAALAVFSSLAVPAAGDISLGLPIDCNVGEDRACYIQVLMDHDETEGVRDHRCGSLSYDGHGGTDFALRSLEQMTKGVNVLASARGVVKAVRDGMPDVAITDKTRAQLQGRDCGNGVVISHGGGWETQYCHLAKGSLQVQKGTYVKTGTVLGRVGLSGRTTFPHVHLSVRKDRQRIDPFAPELSEQCSPDAKDTLWADPLEYQPGGLISAGFTTEMPTYDKVKAGNVVETNASLDAPALIIWGYAFASQAGDVLRLSIRNSGGTLVHATDFKLEKPQAQFFRASGRKTQNADWWRSGTYHGKVEMLRDGKVLSDSDVKIEVSGDL